MKRFMSALLGLALLAPIAVFAQTGGTGAGAGSGQTGSKKGGKKSSKKGGKKSKKGSGGTTTQPPK